MEQPGTGSLSVAKMPNLIRGTEGRVRARCPDCDARLVFVPVDSHQYGISYYVLKMHSSPGSGLTWYVRHQLYRCNKCSRGAYGEIAFHEGARWFEGALETFVPTDLPSVDVADGVPTNVLAELQEAGVCASVGAFRAGSALLRSALEKALIENGYRNGKLFHKIETAATDGVITQSRKTRAQVGVRVLGNDILHDEYREVSEEEFLDSQRYVLKILEDLYDDREPVVEVLREKGRLQ